MCRYDVGLKKQETMIRSLEMSRLRGALTTDELAERYGVSRRSVFRILQKG